MMPSTINTMTAIHVCTVILPDLRSANNSPLLIMKSIAWIALMKLVSESLEHGL